MDENHQDKARSRLITTADKLWLPLLSPQDQKKLDRLRKDRKKPLIVVGISAAFVGVMVLIYKGFSFNWPWWVCIPLILIGIVLLILLIRVGYTTQWTGLKGKTLWDWLNLLGTLAIPLVVAGATLLFGIQQAHLADLQHQNDLKIADGQQQEATLGAYLDDMTTLLLDKKLGSQAVADKAASAEAAVIAQAKTLTALRRLTDPRRKATVVQFLYEANLINNNDVIVDLSDADLSDADLRFTTLSNADLSGANLSGANLSGAELFGANLPGANLSGAELFGADLSEANLFGADLSFADLSGANLFGADLSEANLCHAKEVTQEQLQSALPLKGTTMPNCTKNP